MTTDSKAVCGGGEALMFENAGVPDLPTTIATEVLNLPWSREGLPHDDPTDALCERHGEVQGIVSAALASTAGAGAGDCPSSVPDPVHYGSGAWWFWDESWAGTFGPFKTEQAAREQLFLYQGALSTRQKQSPAVPASPRSGAGEGEEKDWRDRALTNAERLIVFATYHSAKLGQALTDELMEFAAEWQDEVEASSQGGGAGRSEKGEGEEVGRGPSGPGSRADAPSPSVSASGFDPSRYAWSDLSPAEIVRRTRCQAEDLPDEGDSSAQIWRHACDTILLRLGAFQPAPAQSPSTSDAEG